MQKYPAHGSFGETIRYHLGKQKDLLELVKSQEAKLSKAEDESEEEWIDDDPDEDDPIEPVEALPDQEAEVIPQQSGGKPNNTFVNKKKDHPEQLAG